MTPIASGAPELPSTALAPPLEAEVAPLASALLSPRRAPYAPDADLVFSRVPVPLPDDLVDIEFVDMTPVQDAGESVGVEPHAAVITVPGGDVDICGVGGLEALVRTPDTLLDWLGRIEPESEDPDVVQTEEFAPYDVRPTITYGPPA